MVRRGHLGPAEALRHHPNPGVVGGHDHFRQRLGLLAALDHVPDQRLAGDQRQRLPGEPRRTAARGGNTDHFHRALSTYRTRKLHGRNAAFHETKRTLNASSPPGTGCAWVVPESVTPHIAPWKVERLCNRGVTEMQRM